MQVFFLTVLFHRNYNSIIRLFDLHVQLGKHKLRKNTLLIYMKINPAPIVFINNSLN